jgi:hypothetical protein
VNDRDRVRINEAYGRLPISFEANQGQSSEQVKFLSRGHGYTLFLTSREAVLALAKPIGRRTGQEPGLATSNREQAAPPSVIRMQLVGANSGTKVEPQVEQLSCRAGRTTS